MKIFKAIKKGFTLVELVIVIAVIAGLSAVLIPVFGNVVKDSRVSALKASLKTCTSNLIMYSLYNQVDYYTPSVIREFLKSEGIKGLTSEDSEFCEDGYSIWYNQQNYNFYLVKNDELADFVGGGTSSASVNNRNTAAFATDIFGNVADGGVTQGSGENAGASAQLQRIPRRPEAITPDENLLLLATDEANKYILSGIEALYYGADTDKGESSAQQVIINVQNKMANGNLFASFNRNWNIEDYTQKFDTPSTAWLNNVGNFVTDASFSNIDDKQIADITNVIVSPYLGSFSESETNSNKIEGNIRDFGKNEKICLEFVSANPTGYLHVGHGRGAAYGDSLARIMRKVGYDVHKEHYVNDAGNQIINMAYSVYERYKELFGFHIEMKEDYYFGKEIIQVAEEIKDEYGDRFLNNFDLDFFKSYGTEKLLGNLKKRFKKI